MLKSKTRAVLCCSSGQNENLPLFSACPERKKISMRPDPDKSLCQCNGEEQKRGASSPLVLLCKAENGGPEGFSALCMAALSLSLDLHHFSRRNGTCIL